MSPPNDSNSFTNNTIVIFSVLTIVISGYLPYVIGRDDKEDYLQQQKNEQQIEKRNKVN